MPNDTTANSETITNPSKFTSVFSIYFDKDKSDTPNSNPTRIRKNLKEISDQQAILFKQSLFFCNISFDSQNR